MVGWHHPLMDVEFGQTLGDSGGQGGLVCPSLRGHRVRQDLATEQQQNFTFSARSWIRFRDQTFPIRGKVKFRGREEHRS